MKSELDGWNRPGEKPALQDRITDFSILVAGSPRIAGLLTEAINAALQRVVDLMHLKTPNRVTIQIPAPYLVQTNVDNNSQSSHYLVQAIHKLNKDLSACHKCSIDFDLCPGLLVKKLLA